MGKNEKQILEVALKLAVNISERTENPYDNIIVTAAVAILDKVFNLKIRW